MRKHQTKITEEEKKEGSEKSNRKVKDRKNELEKEWELFTTMLHMYISLQS